MERLPDDHIITPEDAAELTRRGACAIGAMRVIGLTVARAVTVHPRNALLYAGDLLSDKQFAEAAKDRPWVALDRAADRLTDEQFAAAAEVRPRAAQIYAPDRYHAWRTANASA